MKNPKMFLNQALARHMVLFLALLAIIFLGTTNGYAQGINYPVGSPAGTSGAGNARTDPDNFFMRNNVAGLTEIPVTDEEEQSGDQQESGKGGWRIYGELQESVYKYTRERPFPNQVGRGISSGATIFNPGLASELTYTSGNHRFGFGIGAYQAFGFQSKFKDDPADFGARATFFDTRVASNDIAMGGAVRLHKTLSVGAAFIFGRGFLDLKAPALQLFAFGTVRQARLDVTDIGAPGVNVNVLFHPVKFISFSAGYKSERTYNLEGKFDTFTLQGFQFLPKRFNAKVEFKIPQVAEFGVQIRPHKKVIVAADFRFYDYTETFGPPIKLIDQDTNTEIQRLVIMGKDVRSARFGIVISATDKTKINLGTAYTSNGFPAAAINPGLVNVGGLDISGGFAKRIHGQWFNFATAVVLGRTRLVGPPANLLFNGRYKGNGVLFSLGMRLNKIPFIQ